MRPRRILRRPTVLGRDAARVSAMEWPGSAAGWMSASRRGCCLPRSRLPGPRQDAGWSLVTMPVTFSERCWRMLKRPRSQARLGGHRTDADAEQGDEDEPGWQTVCRQPPGRWAGWVQPGQRASRDPVGLGLDRPVGAAAGPGGGAAGAEPEPGHPGADPASGRSSGLCRGRASAGRAPTRPCHWLAVCRHGPGRRHPQLCLRVCDAGLGDRARVAPGRFLAGLGGLLDLVVDPAGLGPAVAVVPRRPGAVPALAGGPLAAGGGRCRCHRVVDAAAGLLRPEWADHREPGRGGRP
jgi:hypothetical protein